MPQFSPHVGNIIVGKSVNPDPKGLESANLLGISSDVERGELCIRLVGGEGGKNPRSLLRETVLGTSKSRKMRIMKVLMRPK